jgi:hypothetical protein
MTKVIRLAAWALLVVVAIMTVGPISLRPETSFPVNFERTAAWICIGAMFSFAYPARAALTAAALVGAAGLLELAQIEALGRHGHVLDFLFKACGALLGVGAVHCIGRLLSRA